MILNKNIIPKIPTTIAHEKPSIASEYTSGPTGISGINNKYKP